MAQKKQFPLHYSTKRFVLRPFEASDYKAWRAAHEAQLPKQNEFDEEKKTAKELSRVQYNKMLKRFRGFLNKGVIYPYAIFEKKTGRQMGFVLISLVIRFNVQSARIAYTIFNNYWKHGYGYEVANASIEYAFRKMKLHRLEAEILPHNRASIALAKSLGMQYEGIRKRAVYFEQKWHDHAVYAITAEDRGIKNTKPRIFS